MQYTTHYDSPLGGILLAADAIGLIGLWFDGAKYCADPLEPNHRAGNLPVLDAARRWLDIYFTGREPDFMPPLHMTGSPFRMAVWKMLREIPYGQTTTYGAIAKRLAARRGTGSMSAQAVGGAVGHNPLSIMVPCHRVVGSGGSLTGYAGGVEKKAALLRLEGADVTLTIPAKGTAIRPRR